MHVGFTGTRRGMTQRQQGALRDLLTGTMRATVLHHGDCNGADAQAHAIALLHKIAVHIHSPLNNKERAYCAGASVVYAPKPYRERNTDIVRSSPTLIAAPSTHNEEKKSGTWMTVRIARSENRRIFIIHPNGQVSSENTDNLLTTSPLSSRDAWEDDVVKNAQYFTIFIPTHRISRQEFPTLRDALLAMVELSADNPQLSSRAMVYAVNAAGRSVMLPKADWVRHLRARGEAAG